MLGNLNRKNNKHNHMRNKQNKIAEKNIVEMAHALNGKYGENNYWVIKPAIHPNPCGLMAKP